MEEIFYKCTLLTDVVLNNKMATEGNMTTLDYIPGSNFLGIVAGVIYDKISNEKAYDIFHSGKVSFGDATISDGNEKSYAIPFSLFKDKTNKDKTWVHHFLNDDIHRKLRQDGIQLKQERSGFLTAEGNLFRNLRKNMALKSAQDREARRSKDGAMFGFESLERDQTFIFSVRFQDLGYNEEVSAALEGIKRIGKSKTAQYGQVNIEKIDKPQITTTESRNDKNFTIVYVESNLCILNEYGQSTFQPTVQDLGFEKGKICWNKSQIRTYSYSPWNFKRNTPNTQRDCIAKGSVFFVEGEIKSELQAYVGEYIAEGLGRIIYNPTFLKADPKTAIWGYELMVTNDKKEPVVHSISLTNSALKTALGKYLRTQKKVKVQELDLSNAVQKAIENSSIGLKKISPSQWGGIRACASNEVNVDKLRKKLFDDFLAHGVSNEKYWGKNNGQNLRAFEQIFDANIKHGSAFTVKYAAEMAKESQKLNSKQQ